MDLLVHILVYVIFGVTLGGRMGTCEELRLNIKFLAQFRINPMYISTIILAFVGENGINLVPHPLYSADLAPEVFYNAVRSIAFRWKNCVAATDDYFEGCNLSISDISEAEVSSDSD